MSLQESDSLPANACGYPLQLHPIFQERVWGQEDVSSLYVSRPAEPRRVGEVWLTGDNNRIQNGRWKNTALGELARRLGSTLLGEDVYKRLLPDLPVFPLLVKFIFTSDKLSVQVHPSDSYARQREASAGKTEMWYVIEAEPGAKLAIGFRRDLPEQWSVDRAALRAAVESGGIEQMLNWMEVRAGESFFVPAGTVHAIGAGLVLCEIQQNSDLTYRFYDYNRPGSDGRPRPLHVDKALDVLAWETLGGRTSPLECGEDKQIRMCLAACSHFATEKWKVENPIQCSTARQFEIWIGIEGESEWEVGGQRWPFRKSDGMIIPADVPGFSIIPVSPCVFLRTFVPDLERDVIAPLRARGYSESQLREVCFLPQPPLPGDTR